MTIQRTYNLPNCTLLVEGISLADSSVLAILTNFECKFHHNQERITGGRSLLDTLVKSVSAYVQVLQRGDTLKDFIPSNAAIRLEPAGTYLHNLYVKPTEEDTPNPQPLQIQLSTVQLFDLVESIDRLCSDGNTLPDLNLGLDLTGYTDNSKVGAKVLPAAVGLISLVIAGAALYFVPIPTPQPKPQPQTSSLPVGQPNNKPTSLPSPIADQELITKLKASTRLKIDNAWPNSLRFSKDTEYQVAVNPQGEIVGYKSVMPSTVSINEDELPLKKLLVIPRDPETGGSLTKSQPTTTFKVTFKSNGKLDIEDN